MHDAELSGTDRRRPPRRRRALCARLPNLKGRLNAAVESEVVGYAEIPAEAGKWYQIGNPFADLGGAEVVKLNDVFTTGFSDGDIINIFDSATSTYQPYYWKSAVGAWCTARGTTPVDVNLSAGQAVFISKAMDGDIVFSGVVSKDVSVEFGDNKGNVWNQIVCVYPEIQKLNGMIWSGLADGDIVNVFDAETSTYQPYYWKSASDAWCTARGTTPVDVDIPVGQALFIYKASQGIGTCSVK